MENRLENRKQYLKNITYMAIGIALFVVTSMCLRVPVFENYYLCLGYVVMTVYIWCFKWYEGAAVGFFGVWLYCLIGSLGFNGAPGWAIGNIVIGIILGFTIPAIRNLTNKLVKKDVIDDTKAEKLYITIPLVGLVAVFATFVGIMLVKSAVDMVVVSQPFTVRFIKNLNSFIADAVVIVFSIPICLVLEKPLKKLRFNKSVKK